MGNWGEYAADSSESAAIYNTLCDLFRQIYALDITYLRDALYMAACHVKG